MKKFLSIFLLLATISVSSYAKNGLYLAPKVGFGMSNFNGSVESVFKGAVTAGLGVGYDMSIIGVEASAMYRTAGAKLTYDGSDDAKVSSHYISVPVIAKVFLVGSFHVFVGPQFDFLVGEKISIGDLKNKSDLLKNSGISGIAGAGLDLPLNFGLSLNYNFGLSNVSKLSDLKDLNAGSVMGDFMKDMDGLKNQNISIVLSYKF